MIVNIRWDLAKQIIHEAESGRKLEAIRQIRAPKNLGLRAAKEIVDALTKGDFVIEEYCGTQAMVIVEVADDRITLTLDNCPKISRYEDKGG